MTKKSRRPVYKVLERFAFGGGHLLSSQSAKEGKLDREEGSHMEDLWSRQSQIPMKIPSIP